MRRLARALAIAALSSCSAEPPQVEPIEPIEPIEPDPAPPAPVFPVDPTTERFRIVDGPTGKPTTAMICVRNLETGESFVPPRGEVAFPPTTNRFHELGFEYDGSDPAWAGPVRRTAGPNDRYEDRPAMRWWLEPTMVQTEGAFEIALAPGRYRVSAARGPEYVPVYRDIEVPSGSQSHELVLERWVRMADQGWYSGDLHVHHPTDKQTQRDFLLHYAEASDVHVVGTLAFAALPWEEKPEPDLPDLPVCQGERCLVRGEEDQRIRNGHTIQLDVEEQVFVDDPRQAARATHDQGGVFGFAHFPFHGAGPSLWTLLAPTGTVDYVEPLQFAAFARRAVIDSLDLGVRFSLATGSDIPWGGTMGEVRTYVHVDGEFSPEAWMDGLRRGHSFVTDGPMLSFTVDEALPGTELRREAGSKVHLKARMWGHPSVCEPARLEVLGLGGRAVAVSTHRTDHGIATSGLVRIDRSTWLMAVGACANGATAHSTPVYVVVDGQPTWSIDRGPDLVRERLKELDFLEALPGDGDLRPPPDAWIQETRLLYRSLRLGMESRAAPPRGRLRPRTPAEPDPPARTGTKTP